jgi:hypothetical protein
MGSCAYCGRRATVNIPSNPGDVCLTHAQEFWTGLLAYVSDPVRQVRAAAVIEAGASPQDSHRVPVSRALRPRFINRDSPDTVPVSADLSHQAIA